MAACRKAKRSSDRETPESKLVVDPLNAGDRGLRECAGMSLELARPRVYCGSARAVLELSVVFGLVVMAFRPGDEAVVAERPLLEA